MVRETEHDSIPVRRGRVDSITVYDVTEQELQELERGGDGGTHLNFALSLVSLSISFFISLATTTMSSDRQFIVFVIVAVACLVGAVVFFVLWWMNRKSVRQITRIIRARIPPDELEDSEADTDAVDKKPAGGE